MNTNEIRGYRVFYKAAKAQVQARRDQYAADVKEWYETGDGSAPNWVRAGDQPWFNENTGGPDRMVNMGGKGYRYPVCIHGTDLTTDYDNICGGCEESFTVVQEAQFIARPQWRRYQWVMTAPADLPIGLKRDLIEWVFVVNRF